MAPVAYNLPLHRQVHSLHSCPLISITTLDSNTDLSALGGEVPAIADLFALTLPASAGPQNPKKPWKHVDLIAGRKRTSDSGDVFYEYDLAYAPSKCPDSSGVAGSTLGQGFCPYEYVYLCSAVKPTNGAPVALVVEANAQEYKLANSELKSVRLSRPLASRAFPARTLSPIRFASVGRMAWRWASLFTPT